MTFFNSLFISRNQAPRLLLRFFCHKKRHALSQCDPLLLGLAVERVCFLQNRQYLLSFELVRGILLVLHRIVVSLFTLSASQSDFLRALTAPPYYWYRSRRAGDTDCLPVVLKAAFLCAKSEKTHNKKPFFTGNADFSTEPTRRQPFLRKKFFRNTDFFLCRRFYRRAAILSVPFLPLFR